MTLLASRKTRDVGLWLFTPEPQISYTVERLTGNDRGTQIGGDRDSGVRKRRHLGGWRRAQDDAYHRRGWRCHRTRLSWPALDLRRPGAVFDGQPLPARPNLGKVLDGMADHAELLCDWLGEASGIRDFRKHTGWYLKGFAIGNEVRRKLNKVGSLDELRALLGGLDRTLPFPEGGMRMVRGHHGSARNVHLPQGAG